MKTLAAILTVVLLAADFASAGPKERKPVTGTVVRVGTIQYPGIGTAHVADVVVVIPGRADDLNGTPTHEAHFYLGLRAVKEVLQGRDHILWRFEDPKTDNITAGSTVQWWVITSVTSTSYLLAVPYTDSKGHTKEEQHGLFDTYQYKKESQ